MADGTAKDMEEFEYQLQAQQHSKPDDGSTQAYTDPKDGTVYEWDNERRGWFPKIDGNFLAAYHSSYGFYQTEQNQQEPPATLSSSSSSNDPHSSAGVPQGDSSSSRSEVDEGPPEAKRKRHPSAPSWFDIDDEHNTNIYVSGLPDDTTEEEFHELMTKCGIIMNDDQGYPKMKLYHNSEGKFKGDALCCYLKIESVQLAIQLLDESEFKKKKIRVERARFQMRGSYNPALKKRKKPNKKKKTNFQEKLLDWRERKEGSSRSKFDRIVIFKHLFDPKEFDNDPMLINEIKDDLREECSKLGEVKKVLIFDRNEKGVASVAFKEFESADQCIAAMNGRFYGGKQLEVSTWDGVTNYQIEETEQERKKRLDQWENFLEEGDEKTEPPPPTAAVASSASQNPQQTSNST